MELIITLAIFATLAVFGFSLTERRALAEIDAAAAEIGRALDEGRHQAMLHRREVEICAIDDDGRCAPRSRRLRVFFRNDAQALATVDLSLRGTRFEIKGSFGQARLAFNPDGAAERAGSVYLCSESRPTRHRRLILGPGGLWRELETRSEGVVDGADKACRP